MKAGPLDRKITIMRRSATLSDIGEPEEAWTVIDSRRSASVHPVSGDERDTAPQNVAKEQVDFKIRWSNNVSDLTPLDRIVYPAMESFDPPETVSDRRIYDILYVSEIGHKDGLMIRAVRRADTVVDSVYTPDAGPMLWGEDELTWGDEPIVWGSGS